MSIANIILGAFGILVMTFGAFLIWLYSTSLKLALSYTLIPTKLVDLILWAFFITAMGIIVFAMAWVSEKCKSN